MVLLLSTELGYAQSDEIKNYFLQLKSAKHDTDRVNIYYEVAQLYWFTNPDSALLMSQKGLDLAKKIDFKMGLARCYFTIGALFYYKSDYPAALSYYLKTLKIGEEIGLARTISSSCFNIGMVYFDLGNYQQATSYFQKALRIAYKAKDQQLIASVLGYMGEICIVQKKYNLALKYKHKSLTINRKIKSLSGVADDLHSIGVISLTKSEFDTSLLYVQEALKNYQKTYNKAGIAACYNVMAEVYQKQNKFAQSIRYAEMSIGQSKMLGDKALTKKSYNILYLTYQQLKNYEKALAYRDLEITLKDSTFSIEKERAVNQLQATYDLEKKQHQIDLLNKNKIIQQEALEKNIFQRNTFIGGVIVLILLILILVRNNWLVKHINAVLKQQNIEISQQKEEINEQNARLEELNNLKNKLLSIVSHDFRGPLYSLLGVVNLMKQGDLTNQEINYMASLVSERLGVTIHLLENLLHWAKAQLEGTEVYKSPFDLGQIIEQNTMLVRSQADQKKVVLESPSTEAVMAYGDSNMIDIVVRNLLANAIKFSKSGDTVSVNMVENGEFIYVKVKDTGQGIALENQPKIFNGVMSFTTMGTANEKGTGLGLALCKELVVKNGGSIWFESELGRGSTFVFTIPKMLS